MKLHRTLAIIASLALPAFVKADEAVSGKTIEQVSWAEVVNDVPFKKEDLKGKVVVVEEWGVNCPPCIASLPDLAKLAKRYEKKGVVVVGLERQGGSKETILKLLKEARVKYPVMSGGGLPVSTGGIPHAAVFAPDGKLIWHGNPHDDEFERSVKKAMKDLPKS